MTKQTKIKHYTCLLYTSIIERFGVSVKDGLAGQLLHVGKEHQVGHILFVGAQQVGIGVCFMDLFAPFNELIPGVLGVEVDAILFSQLFVHNQCRAEMCIRDRTAPAPRTATDLICMFPFSPFACSTFSIPAGNRCISLGLLYHTGTLWFNYCSIV